MSLERTVSPLVTVQTKTWEGREEGQHEYMAGPLHRSLGDAGTFRATGELVFDLMKAGTERGLVTEGFAPPPPLVIIVWKRIIVCGLIILKTSSSKIYFADRLFFFYIF